MNSLTPERRRWIILVLVFLAVVVSYIDRQIVSVLKPTIKTAFGIDDRGFALLVNVFVLCYAGAYPVAGWLVDRFGAGRIMLIGIIGWSIACMSAAFTRTFGQMAFCRGALGVIEPLAFPAQLRVVTTWFPPALRATANSLCVSGGTIGAVVAAPLVAWLTIQFNWHMAFIVPGAIGLVLAVLWRLIYRDPPVSRAAEPEAAAPRFRWAGLWRTRSLWGILLIRFISDPVWYFCLFWLPGYLQEESGLSLAQVGMFGWIPFLVADLGGIGSSLFSDRLVKRGLAPLRSRKLTLLGAAFLAPVCALTPHLPHPAATLVIFSFVAAMCLTWLWNLGVVVAEAFPAANIGSVWGIAGGCGALGAMFFNTFVGEAMATFGPARVFILMAFLHPLASIVLWTMVRKESPPLHPLPVPPPQSSVSCP